MSEFSFPVSSTVQSNSWWRRWIRATAWSPRQPRVGLALGGGFARGIAHIGVLRVLEREGIPIHAVAGVSAGAMVAGAWASGTTSDEIEHVARSMKFRDVARWTISRLGFVRSECMAEFLERLLKVRRFEQMHLPLGVVASSLNSGKAVVFKDRGDVVVPIRASCAYPGLFQPIRYRQQFLVDGNVSMEVPAPALRTMGVSHIISVFLPSAEGVDPDSMFSVVQRCFSILAKRSEKDWRYCSNLVITPQVADLGWNAFGNATELIRAGEEAARAVLPRIEKWLTRAETTTPPLVREARVEALRT